MKKISIIISFLSLIIAMPVWAQDNDTRGRNWTFYGQMGFSNMRLSGTPHGINDTSITYNKKKGYSLLFGARRQLNHSQKVMLFYAAEVGLQSRGYSIDSSWTGLTQIPAPYGMHDRTVYYSYSGTLIAHNVYLSPAIIGLKLKVIGNFSLVAHVGAFMSYDYNGILTNETRRAVQGVYGSDYTWITSQTLDEIDTYHRLDAGTNVGIGFCYDRVYVGLTYQQGLVDLTSECQWNTRRVAVNVGFCF